MTRIRLILSVFIRRIRVIRVLYYFKPFQKRYQDLSGQNAH